LNEVEFVHLLLSLGAKLATLFVKLCGIVRHINFLTFKIYEASSLHLIVQIFTNVIENIRAWICSQIAFIVVVHRMLHRAMIFI
jgi:hypothetical protein